MSVWWTDYDLPEKDNILTNQPGNVSLEGGSFRSGAIWRGCLVRGGTPLDVARSVSLVRGRDYLDVTRSGFLVRGGRS